MVGPGTKSHYSPGPSVNECVSVPMGMSAYESETKSHLGQGSYGQIRDQIALGLGSNLYACMSAILCKRVFESKTKSHLGKGSNDDWIWDQIAFGSKTKSEYVCECVNVHECI